MSERLRRGLYRFRRSWVSVLGLGIVCLLLLIAILGPAIVPHPEHVAGLVQTGTRFQPPSAAWWFGTNEVGQDVFSLTLAGTRVSLLAGMAVVIVGAVIGVFVGAIAGFFGGWLDEGLMRLSDLMLTVPSLILAMAVAAALGPGTGNMIFAIALSWWPGYARLVRGEVMAKKEEQFVTAARAMGAGSGRLLRRHVLPNIVSPVIVKMSLDMGFAILTVASLGFVGIGVKPPTPEWGSLLSVARANMPDYWWTAIFPGLAIFLAVFGFNLLGDGLRDLLDPKARR
ncbi:D-ala-D-ala transporter subunit [Pseudoroseomonas deserti]|uniref:D-ala-D-ala transporter subunit n=1 Tax=Teichococcus deserti TaxID=1817963 RepID=A0A1V2H210_9PROT|nr:ABC transporter permease [Pseudoroseomonas deserti]ONG53148.1 D-ala-D-ala transporter subunit [Pseudoroseomonas deserti]